MQLLLKYYRAKTYELYIWYKLYCKIVFLNYFEPLSTGWFRMMDAGLHNISMNVVESLDFWEIWDHLVALLPLHWWLWHIPDYTCSAELRLHPTFLFPLISQYKTLYTILMPGLGHVNLLQTSTHNPLTQNWETKRLRVKLHVCTCISGWILIEKPYQTKFDPLDNYSVLIVYLFTFFLKVNPHSNSNSESYQERLARLEGDKESLILQVRLVSPLNMLFLHLWIKNS